MTFSEHFFAIFFFSLILMFISSLTFLNGAFSIETVQCPMMGWLLNDELEII